MTDLQSRSPAEHVVGVGASAGGLEALTQVLAEVPASSPFAWVIVTHLAPDHETMLHDILTRRTALPIELVENEVELQAGHGYVIPPGQEMIVSQGRLLLTARDRAEVPNFPIDAFLRSLASEYGPHAAAIVLSGTGRDGQRGVEHVHEQGGLVIAQSRDEARFPSMPAAALDTGLCDLELPASAMQAALVEHLLAEPVVESTDPEATDLYPRIFRAVRQRLRVDFAQYKLTTVSRRIERRMSVVQAATLADYADLVERSDEEVDALYAELLIGVTRFFRDVEAWSSLERQVAELLGQQPHREELRAWCVACATGEEAYTLAICLFEAMRKRGESRRFRLFASDVHRGCLEIAGAGRYPRAAVEGLPASILQRYFRDVDDDHVEVSKEVRDAVVFAHHDVTRDPPFTRMDLVTCRNLLIYFRPATQRRVLTLFHFALRANGLLLLGPSETSSPLDDEFTTLDRAWRLFRKRRDVRLHPDFRHHQEMAERITHRTPRAPTSVSPIQGAMRSLIELHAPPSVVVGPLGHVLHSFSGGARFLTYADGAPSTHLLDLLHGDLKNAVSAALQSCRRGGDGASYRGVRHGETLVDVRATSLRSGDGPSDAAVLVTFSSRDDAPPDRQADVDADDLAAERLRQLESELHETRENLHTALEEMETSNEELQATNEELLASNEELQATNEELNSVNEELYSVNEEYQDKIVQLQQLSNDMEHILRAGDINLLFLDEELCIRTFTPGMRSLLGLVDHDQGRSVELFASLLRGPDWIGRAAEVVAGGPGFSEEVSGPGGIPYLLRLQPYRPEHGRGRGAVLVLSDLREVKAAEAERLMLARMIESSTDFISVLDPDGRIVRLNQGARELLARHGVGRGVPTVDTLLDEEGRASLHIAQSEARRRGAWRGRLHLCLGEVEVPVVAVVDHNPHGPEGELFTLICHDVSELVEAQDLLVQQDRNKDRFLAALSHELRNPTSALFRAVDLLEIADGEDHDLALAVARRQLHALQRLLDDLLDASRVAAGRIDLARGPVALSEVVEAARDTVMHIHPGARIEVGAMPDLWCDGDATRLEQIVINLLTNAVKYGGAKPIQVRGQREGDQARIAVRDFGVGLDAEDLVRVFEPFFRADVSDASGMGIGLGLSRDLARLHDGRIEVSSQGLGEGATFALVVPTMAPPSGAAEDGSDGEDDGEESGADAAFDIVVVDDNEDSARLLGIALEVSGHRVRVGHTIAEGRELLLDHRADVAILDLQLPDGTGFDLARELADHPCRPRHLLALSGLGQPEDLAASADAGFDEHLVKPVDLDELEARLAAFSPS